ncbi:MAG: 1-acyl-sn-glycerol-3-phosphate acyltransferase [Vampirovibrionales bacterium]|nr:1-acyl-sn-glycerol-3-phosphate acyltransferase [Vampirovibrionales bacterium]
MTEPQNLNRFAQRKLSDYNTFRWWFYRLSWSGLWILFRLRYDLVIVGREHIPRDTSRFIVAANHVSNFDPVCVGLAIDRYNTAFLAKRELFVHPVMGWIMDHLGTIAVNRDKVEIATVRAAKLALEAKGWCMGLFPEGTRVKDGKVSDPKKGAAFIARATQAPILPAAVTHTQRGRGKRLLVTLGAPIPYEGQDVDTLTEILMHRIEALKAQGEQCAADRAS